MEQIKVIIFLNIHEVETSSTAELIDRGEINIEPFVKHKDSWIRQKAKAAMKKLS